MKAQRHEKVSGHATAFFWDMFGIKNVRHGSVSLYVNALYSTNLDIQTHTRPTPIRNEKIQLSTTWETHDKSALADRMLKSLGLPSCVEAKIDITVNMSDPVYIYAGALRYIVTVGQLGDFGKLCLEAFEDAES